MTDDLALLRRYVEFQDEEAFAELVRRYLTLVYHAALRQAGDAPMAEEVTQRTFLLLAKKARSLLQHQTLAGWLHTTTRHVAREAFRAERRRRTREHEVYMLHEISRHESAAAADWERLRPTIDEALGELSDSDREAVLLRFFAGLPLAAIGAQLRLSENAARMRVERALEKLRARLARRGVTSTGAALALALANQSATAVPVALAGTVTSTALAGAAAGWTGAFAGATAFMSMTKLGFGAAGIAVLASALGLAVSERQALRREEAAVASASRDYEAARGRLSGLEQQGRAEERAVVRGAVEVGAPAARPLSAAEIAAETEAVNELVRANAKAAGDLLMARHPEVKQAFLDWGDAVLNAECLSLYRALNLSLAQIEQFQALHRGQSPLHMETEASSGGLNDVVEAIELNVPALEPREREARLRELLGADGYRTFLESRRTSGARQYAVQLAETLCFSSAPLTADQAEEIVRIVERHSTRAPARLVQFDWDAIGVAAKSILTAEQLPALRVVRAEDRYRQAHFQALEPGGETKP